MKWFRNHSEIVGVLIIAVGMITIACTLAYLTTNKAANDPEVQRTFKLTLITGDKKEQIFWLNKGSDVWVESYKGSYWLKCNWHSKAGWNTKILKPGVIDFEEIK